MEILSGFASKKKHDTNMSLFEVPRIAILPHGATCVRMCVRTPRSSNETPGHDPILKHCGLLASLKKTVMFASIHVLKNMNIEEQGQQPGEPYF